MKVALTCFALLFSVIACKKMPLSEGETPPHIIDFDALEVADTVTRLRTYRDDIPPPPRNHHQRLDEETLSPCVRKVWGALKYFYQVSSTDETPYNIYSYAPRPVTYYDAFLMEDVSFDAFNVDAYQANGILQDTTLQCWTELDAAFFKEVLGPPSCEIVGYATGDTTLNYYITSTWRNGPCPWYPPSGTILPACIVSVAYYCPAVLTLEFQAETGYLIYVDFK